MRAGGRLMRAGELAALLARPIAHRGLHACGARGPIENSIEAAHAAVTQGFGIECDVQLSADGEAIVFHDTTLDRLTSVTGRLADLGAEAISRTPLRGGGLIPTLDTLLAAIGGRVPLVIEIKADGDHVLRLTDRVLARIEAYTGVVAIESFDPAVVLHARRAGVTRPVGLVGPADEKSDADPPEAGHRADKLLQDALAAADFLSWSIGHLPAPVDLPLSAWTVRTHEQHALALGHGAQIVFEGVDPRR